VRKFLALAAIAALGLGASAQAVIFTGSIYNGNGNSGFGGAIGGGSLSLTDDGVTLSGTFTKGSGGFDNSLVIYVDSAAGGFADTSTLGDAHDGLRRSISGFDGGSNRSTLTFGGTFRPDYAIALGPNNSQFGGAWQLVAGGDNSLNYVDSVNLTPTGTGTSSTYDFSIALSKLGIAPGQTVQLLGTYISDSGYRSDEAIAGNTSGSQGWTAFTGTSATYTATPEPASLGLLGLGAVGLLRRRKMARRK